MLLDLSVELLEAIGAQLTHTDHAVLRQVCKDLNGAVCRLFFSVLCLKTHQNGLSKDAIEKLKVLGTDNMTSEERAHNDKLVDLFCLRLSVSVKNPKCRDLSGWGQTAILHFLNTLSNLHDLELDIPSTLDISELKVQTLRRFTLKTPGWGRGPSWQPITPEVYEDFMDLIISQTQLNSLHVEGFTELSAVWRMLRRKPYKTAKLTEITTNVVTQEFFDYLTSYSGLKKLTLKFPDGGNVEESNRLADSFFETVLPCHSESLAELSCPAAYESRFSFGTHNVDVVSSLHKLTKLEMSINAGAVRKVNPPKGRNRKYSSIGFGISVKAEQADIDPVVTLLLETAVALPALRSLTIVSAETERNRAVWCGNGRIHHQAAVDMAIGTAVMAFRTDMPCAAIVYADGNTHELRPRRGSLRKGRLGYEQTGSWSWD
ncbi:hypothetical protein MSAN_01587100 [Mycena sanguinolenta]|uniref:F-box domain-containing protein n=1 Tax=Mycena sanguinolenta TaxID=230812 RepID=A0A8H6Y401_9AGAR|nr:hypothetical protein MSAN_01587100 [Mycena sanguinolenta]